MILCYAIITLLSRSRLNSKFFLSVPLLLCSQYLICVCVCLFFFYHLRPPPQHTSNDDTLSPSHDRRVPVLINILITLIICFSLNIYN